MLNVNLNLNYYFGDIFLNINFLFILGLFLFCLGLFGTFYRVDRLIIFLMCIELMWLGVGVCFLSSYIYFLTPVSLVFALIILAMAAAETAIGLSLLVNFYRINKSISLRFLSNLRGNLTQ